MFFYNKLFKKLQIIYFYSNILHYACLSGLLEFVKYIISLKKIDINAKDITTFIFFNRILIFEYVYDITYNILSYSIHNIIYLTIFHYACISNNLDLVKYLLKDQKIHPYFRDKIFFIFSYD